MKRILKIYLFGIGLCFLLGNNPLCGQTTSGTDFWLAFGQNRTHGENSPNLDLEIRIAATEATTVTLTFTHLSGANKVQTISIPGNTTYCKTLDLAERGATYTTGITQTVTNRSVHITSTKSVSVYALNKASNTVDATNVFPTNTLGTDYYHFSYAVNANSGTNKPGQDAMTLVAIEDNTLITIDTSGHVILHRTLNKGEVFYLPSDIEMTGYHVFATKPIAYFVTHKGTMIPNIIQKNADNLFQQMAPVNSWGTHFLVPDIGYPSQQPLLAKIIASQDGTIINYQGTTGGSGSVSLDKGRDISLSVDISGCSISSNNPIGVCVYLLSYSPTASFGGPALVWIPPVEQMVNETTIAPFVLTVNIVNDHNAVIIAPTSSKQLTTMIKDSIISSLSMYNWTDNPNGYSFTKQHLPDSLPYTFSNPDGLAVLVYGLGPSDSYYYLAGASVHNLNMMFSVNEVQYQDILGKTVCTDTVNFAATVKYAQRTAGYMKWYINNVEETAKRDQLTWEKIFTPGTYDVRMDVVDVSGDTQSINTTFSIELPAVAITGPTEIEIGNTTTLSPTTGGTWASSDATIATVQNNGTVTGISKGSVQFTFTSTGGCSLQTDVIKVEDYKVATDTMIIVTGDTVTCYKSSATLTANASMLTNPVFRWYASQTETTPFHTGTNYTTSVLTADTIFYISVSDNDYSENEPGKRKAVKVKVKQVCTSSDSVIFCENASVSINVLTNDNLSPDCKIPVIEIVVAPKHGLATVNGTNIEYTGQSTDMDSLTYIVRCGTDTSMSKIYFILGTSTTAFVDDIWYFGINLKHYVQSPGIEFLKNSSGQYVARDASGKSNVYSYENSLVVSSPYCDGQTIFYSNHSQVYNSLHGMLKNGAFPGNSSISDGLAACYMGDNKYLFFTVTGCYEDVGANAGLRAYIIDMSEDNGEGALIPFPNGIIETANTAESIELVACEGTTNKYWLIYAYCSSSSYFYSDELRVRLIDVSDPNNPIISGIHSIAAKTRDMSYSLVVSPDFNRIAVANSGSRTVDVYSFNNATGTIYNRHSIGIGYSANRHIYSAAFSPDGDQLYFSVYNQVANEPVLLYQYSLYNMQPQAVDSIKYWSQTTDKYKGGGLKLGPDGKIYVTQSYTNQVGSISNPNLTTPLSARYTIGALTLSVTYRGLQFSTGLTKPAIMPCNMNNAPRANADSALMCFSPTSQTVKVKVLANDRDMDNDKIYLTNAYFVNKADTAYGTITVNAADSTVSLTVKNIGDKHIFDIIYDIKDNGLPASQCATGSLKITVFSTPALSSTRTPVPACSDSIFNYKATSTVTSFPTTFAWSRAAVSGIAEAATSGTDENISEKLTNTSPNPVTVTYLFTLATAECRGTDTMRVIVYPKLMGGTISGSQAHCFGEVLDIAMPGTLPSGGKGNYTYQWQNSIDSIAWNNIGITDTGYTLTGTLTQTTWYRRVASDTCGTAYSNIVKITIDSLPVISAVSEELCVGTNTLLSPITGGTWVSSNAGIVSIDNNHTALGIAAGKATLTFTSSTTGCIQSFEISVDTFPDVEEITGLQTVCLNESIQLTNPTTGGEWTSNHNGVTISNPNANPVTITGAKEGAVFISYTVKNGICQTKKTYSLKIIPSKIPLIDIGIPR